MSPKKTSETTTTTTTNKGGQAAGQANQCIVELPPSPPPGSMGLQADSNNAPPADLATAINMQAQSLSSPKKSSMWCGLKLMNQMSLTVLYTRNLAVWSLTSELLSLRWSNGQRDIGFNLCVVPFPNVCVPNFKLEDLHQRCLEWLESPKVGGLKVQRC